MIKFSIKGRKRNSFDILCFWYVRLHALRKIYDSQEKTCHKICSSYIEAWAQVARCWGRYVRGGSKFESHKGQKICHHKIKELKKNKKNKNMWHLWHSYGEHMSSRIGDGVPEFFKEF